MELEAEKRLSPDQIIQRLGNPKELAGAYLGQSLSQSSSFSFRRLGQAILFYSLAGLGGIFLLPFTTILAGALLVCGVIAPVSGLIQAVGFLLGFDVPWVSFRASCSFLEVGSSVFSPPIRCWLCRSPSSLVSFLCWRERACGRLLSNIFRSSPAKKILSLPVIIEQSQKSYKSP